MFSWDRDKIGFLKDASEYTPFDEALAQRAMAHFNANARVLDAGCGLGYLSLALSPYCQTVTAADISKDALSVLENNIQTKGITNIRVWEADAWALPSQAQFDSIVFNSFGGTEDILKCVKAHCQGRAVLFKKCRTEHRFSLQQTPMKRVAFDKTCQDLTDLGIPFYSETFDLDVGQPFRSLEDAIRFFTAYAQEGTVPDAGEIQRRLTVTSSAEFPYYLPVVRPIGMIVIDAADVQTRLQG